MTGINKIKYTSQEIDNLSFDDGLGVSIVEVIGADGVLKNPATEETLQAVLAASGGSLPYDTVEVDTSNPVSITITKKNGTEVIDVKTINII